MIKIEPSKNYLIDKNCQFIFQSEGGKLKIYLDVSKQEDSKWPIKVSASYGRDNKEDLKAVFQKNIEANSCHYFGYWNSPIKMNEGLYHDLSVSISQEKLSLMYINTTLLEIQGFTNGILVKSDFFVGLCKNSSK